jgi:SAM-dependent methyltransferase
MPRHTAAGCIYDSRVPIGDLVLHAQDAGRHAHKSLSVAARGTEASGESPYLLGDSLTEQQRLDLQASLWDPVSHALFDRIGVAPTWRVLEVGPGTGTLNLELRRRVEAPVDVVEPSPAYRAALQERWLGDGFGAAQVWETPLRDADLPSATYDLVFARWVFLFLPDAQTYVAQLAQALKPGGWLAVQDYFRDTFVLVPRPADWEALVAADRAFFASTGGDVNIGTQLPSMFQACGLDVQDVSPTTKSGHPGSAVWTWLTTYFLGVLDRYATLGPLTPDAAARIAAAWKAAAHSPASLLIGPTVLDVVGRKPQE